MEVAPTPHCTVQLANPSRKFVHIAACVFENGQPFLLLCRSLEFSDVAKERIEAIVPGAFNKAVEGPQTLKQLALARFHTFEGQFNRVVIHPLEKPLEQNSVEVALTDFPVFNVQPRRF